MITQNPGSTNTVTVTFVNDSQYSGSDNTGTLTVNVIPTSLTVNPTNGYKGDNTTLTATLWDTAHNIPVADKSVSFFVNGVSVGTGVSNVNGVVNCNYIINQNVGTYLNIVGAVFSPCDNLYNASNGNGTLTVNAIPTSISVNPINGYKGDLVNLVTNLTDTHNNLPINDETVQFSVNGNIIGSASTNSLGIATLAYTIQQYSGSYPILAHFLGDSLYNESSNTNNLNVALTPTAISMKPINGFKGDLVNLIANLTDTHNNLPINGKNVQFSVNGNIIGTNSTNSDGIATLAYTIQQYSGSYPILAHFLGDSLYNESSNTNNLNVALTPTAISMKPINGFKGDLVNLIANLTDTHNNLPLNGKNVQFSVNGNIIGTNSTNSDGIATLAYTIQQNSGSYPILAQFINDSTFATSSNSNNLIVGHTPTNVTINTVTGNKGETINLTATLTDTLHKITISGKIIHFLINGNLIGSSITNNNGIATLPYTIIQNGGYYNIKALFNGDNVYNSSNGGSKLKVPQSNIYVAIININNHHKLGETVKVIFKVGNKGPDTAKNVILTLKISEGMEYMSATVNTGLFNYNPTTRTITWNISDVPVGDPILILNAKLIKHGKNTFKPTITTTTSNT